MKSPSKNEGLLKRTYFLPEETCKNLEKTAKEHHRSINEELIVILQEFFDNSIVKLDPTIKNAIDTYAKTKGFTVTQATNYLVSTAVSVFEEVLGVITKEADNDYPQIMRSEETERDTMEWQERDDGAKKGKKLTG